MVNTKSLGIIAATGFLAGTILLNSINPSNGQEYAYLPKKTLPEKPRIQPSLPIIDSDKIDFGTKIENDSLILNYDFPYQPIDTNSVGYSFMDLSETRIENGFINSSFYDIRNSQFQINPFEFYASRAKNEVQSVFRDIAFDWAKNNYFFEGSWAKNIADYFMDFPERWRITSPLNPTEGVPGSISDKEASGRTGRWILHFEASEDRLVSLVYKANEESLLNFQIGKRAEIITHINLTDSTYFYSGIKEEFVKYNLEDILTKRNLDIQFSPSTYFYSGISTEIGKKDSFNGLNISQNTFNLGFNYLINKQEKDQLFVSIVFTRYF